MTTDDALRYDEIRMRLESGVERRIVVLGCVEAARVSIELDDACGWRLVEGRSPDEVEALLAAGRDLRVGIWAQGAELSGEDLDSFSTLRARHRRVQWLALLPPQCVIDERS